MFGSGGNDLLVANAGNDLLDGGLGRDHLHGQEGADTFLWRSTLESTSSAKDDVFGFSRAEGDRLNLALIDAKDNIAGNQQFTFIGDNAFSVSGQVRYDKSGSTTLILLNTDSDKGAEAIICLIGADGTPERDWFVM